MSKRIKLTQGKYALVDDIDFDRVSQFSWYANKRKHTYYAQRIIYLSGGQHTLFLHRFILNLKLYDGKQADHIDGDGLNNQRSNLRKCTLHQNRLNRRPQSGVSKYKGVNWHRVSQKWRAKIKKNRKDYYLGLFSNEIDAAKAYDRKAKELHGEFARLNFTEVPNE